MARAKFNLATVIATIAALWLLAGWLGAQQRDPLPVPDVAGFRTLKCDFHMHTVFSDGEVWPTTRVREAWREGLDCISITDHAGYNPNKDDVRPDLKRPYEIARPLAEQLGLILIPGVEVMKGDTHFNILFVSNPNAFFEKDLTEALKEGRKQGGFTFWNHPGWKQTADWFPEIAELYNQKLMDGIELVNGLTYYREAFPWIEEKGLTILCNSDVHAPTYPSYTDRKRPITLVFARTPDVAGIRDALFARRTVAWMGGELWGSEAWLRGLWDRAVTVETPELSFAEGQTAAALRLVNRTAIPFQMRLAAKPEWLTASNATLDAEGAVAITVRLGEKAPKGTSTMALEYEIRNLHVAPERNLVVRIPLRIVRK